MKENPFSRYKKNAKDTQKKWGEHKQKSNSYNQTCKQCGAARPKDSNLIICDYCGYKFMDIDGQIHIKDE